MGKYKDAIRHEIEGRQKRMGEITTRALDDLERSKAFQRFAPSPLQAIDSRFQNISTFLPEGQRSNIGMMNYQGTPGQMYANAPDVAPGTKFGTNLYPSPPPVQTPVVATPPPDSGKTTPPSDVGGMDPDLDQLEMINAERKRLGYPEFESMEDFYDFISDISEGGPGGPYGSQIPFFYQGGIAQLPVEMSLGGVMQGIGKGLGALSRGMNAGGGGGVKGVESAGSGFDAFGGKKIEDMTREELIEYIKSGKANSSESSFGSDLKTIGQGIGKLFGKGAGAPTPAADGGLMHLAQGDMVEEFPRVNGPISGPGTETSDDIPAMLSDGEFVVNAKAVRGIGKLKGANKSKAEQRREGAKMMYALQRAGEKAMRRA
jgi:hypothetical protein